MDYGYQIDPVAAGNSAVKVALQCARAAAHRMRTIGLSRDYAAFDRGQVGGMLIVANTWLRPNKDDLMAADNEANFLLGPYLEGCE